MHDALIGQLSASAIMAHPRFVSVLQVYAERLLTIHRGERLMNQLLAQREREFLGFLLLCMHYAHLEGGPPPTLARLIQSGLGSPRRIAAFVAVLRVSGFVHARLDPADRRQRILEPAARLIALHRDWTLAAFRQLDELLGAPILERRLTEDAAFHRRACLIGAEEVLRGASFALGRFPLVDFLTPRRGGHLVAASLAHALCAGGVLPDGPVPPIDLSYGRLARRLGVSRSHVLNLFAETADKGWLGVQDAGRRIQLTAEAAHDLFSYFAHELAFIGQHALSACDPTVEMDIAWLSR
jgi:AraC-like DNA-binding protein